MHRTRQCLAPRFYWDGPYVTSRGQACPGDLTICRRRGMGRAGQLPPFSPDSSPRTGHITGPRTGPGRLPAELTRDTGAAALPEGRPSPSLAHRPEGPPPRYPTPFPREEFSPRVLETWLQDWTGTWLEADRREGHSLRRRPGATPRDTQDHSVPCPTYKHTRVFRCLEGSPV